MKHPDRPRVLFFQPSPIVAQAEYASALRRHGVIVELVLPTAAQEWKKQRRIDHITYNKVHYILSDQDSDQPLTAAASLMAEPRIRDVQAFDELAYAMAVAFQDKGLELPPGLLASKWYDKWWLAERLQELTIPTPNVWREPKSDQFPVVVKLPVSSGGMGVRVAHDAVELDAAWEELSQEGTPFLQKYIGGESISVTGVADRGRLTAAVLYRQLKDPNDLLGPSVRQQVVDPNEPTMGAILANVTALIADCGYSGPFSVQQLVDNGVGYVMDFNARVVGAWASLEQIGAGLLDASLATLAGKSPPSNEPAVKLRSGESSSLRISYDESWASWSDGAEWGKRTARQIAGRSKWLGWRYGVWSTAMGGRLGMNQTKDLRIRRQHSHPYDPEAAPFQIQTVCLGNICRSPMAAAVIAAKLHEAGLADRVAVTSSGTSRYHIGKDMDKRTRAALARRGYNKAHTVTTTDPTVIGQYDLVLAMDHANLADLDQMPGGGANVRLMRSFDPAAEKGAEVPDPYHGEEADFEHALDLIVVASDGVVAYVRDQLAPSMPQSSLPKTTQ